MTEVATFTARVTAASATACLACYVYTGIINDLSGLTSCCSENIGLVSLISLGAGITFL